MQPGLDIEYDLAELRRPSRLFICPRHETAMMMYGFDKRCFEEFSGVEYAVAAFAEACRPALAYVREWCHKISRPLPADTTVSRHEVKIPDIFHQPRIGLLLRRYEQWPIGWIGNVFEQINRRVDTAYDRSEEHTSELQSRENLV